MKKHANLDKINEVILDVFNYLCFKSFIILEHPLGIP